jgi:hypothetical protein
MREICFFRTSAGECPVENFLAGLSTKHAQRVAWVLRLVKELPVVPQREIGLAERRRGDYLNRTRKL